MLLFNVIFVRWENQRYTIVLETLAESLQFFQRKSYSCSLALQYTAICKYLFMLACEIVTVYVIFLLRVFFVSQVGVLARLHQWLICCQLYIVWLEYPCDLIGWMLKLTAFWLDDLLVVVWFPMMNGARFLLWCQNTIAARSQYTDCESITPNALVLFLHVSSYLWLWTQ